MDCKNCTNLTNGQIIKLDEKGNCQDCGRSISDSFGNIYQTTNNMENLHTALLKAQMEFPLIKKTDANPFFKSKYAGLPSILEVVLPILHKNKLVLFQSPVTDGDRIGVKTILTYAPTGEQATGEFTTMVAKNDPQGAGSAITYCRRYALVSMLGLNVDEDDDGVEASKPKEAITGGVVGIRR